MVSVGRQGIESEFLEVALVTVGVESPVLEAGGAGEGAADEKQGGAARDITLARLFARQAGHRFDLNMELLRGADDDLLTAASQVAYDDRGYHLA